MKLFSKARSEDNKQFQISRLIYNSTGASDRSFYPHFEQKVWSLRNIADNTQTQKSFVSWVTARAFSAQSLT